MERLGKAQGSLTSHWAYTADIPAEQPRPRSHTSGQGLHTVTGSSYEWTRTMTQAFLSPLVIPPEFLPPHFVQDIFLSPHMRFTFVKYWECL